MLTGAIEAEREVEAVIARGNALAATATVTVTVTTPTARPVAAEISTEAVAGLDPVPDLRSMIDTIDQLAGHAVTGVIGTMKSVAPGGIGTAVDVLLARRPSPN